MADYNRFLESVCERLEVFGVQMYTDNRPIAVDKRLSEFIVVELAGGIRPNEQGGYGSDYDWLSGTVGIVIFVRDHTKAQNVTEASDNRLGSLTSDVLKLFPYKDNQRGVTMRKPYLLTAGISDGEGFHYSRVNVRVTTI